MSRVLIITGENPAHPAPGRALRRAQMQRFYHAEGHAADLMVLHPPGGPEDRFRLDPGDARRIAQVPVWSAPRGRDRARVLEMIGQLSDGEGYALVHLDAVDLPPDRDVSGLWIHDAFDGCADLPEAPGLFDLTLAALEHVRDDLAHRGAEAVRLPLALPEAHIPPTGQMLGWPERLGDWRRGGCEALLDAMTARGCVPEGGLGFGFEDDGAMRVSALLVPVLRLLGTGDRAAARRAIALGLFPFDDPGPDYADLVRMVAEGRPVLALDGLAARFEGRWHLPTAGRPEDLAPLVHGWVTGDGRDWLAEEARRTRDALAEDAASMTAHVAQLLTRPAGAEMALPV